MTTFHNCDAIPRFIAIAFFAAMIAEFPAHAEIVRDIDARTEALRSAAHGADTDAQVAALERAINNGDRASNELKSQIKALEDEKRALEKIQVVLTSGLIGALVTAFVAIMGTVVSFSRGRAERDLKRLEVLQKSAELEAKGISVPGDIRANYVGR